MTGAIRSLTTHMANCTTICKGFWCFADRASQYNLSNWPT